MESDWTFLAQAWLVKADHDLETSRRVVVGKPPITDTAVYHCNGC